MWAIIIVKAISVLLDIIQFLILARAILSWLPMGYNSPLNGVNNVLVFLTEPFIAPARKFLYRFQVTRNLPIDFSPWLAILVLYVISRVLINALILFGA